MDKDIELRPDIEEKPHDELGGLDDQFEDLLNAAEHASNRRQRFALVVDATSSMYVVWDKAKTALKDAVDTITASSPVPVELCVVAYRDHLEDAPESVVEASEWTSDSDELKTYIAGMRCHGGGDFPESIGHGLAHLKRQQQQIHQIILIGDAPSKPGSYGYAEAQAFGATGCPIYALYTDQHPRTVECFKKIAKLSGGQAHYLQNLKNMADLFKVLLASNKALAIEYQPTTDEGRKMKEAMR